MKEDVGSTADNRSLSDVGKEEEEEEETTISWTSSIVSLSPDNPLYHQNTTASSTTTQADSTSSSSRNTPGGAQETSSLVVMNHHHHPQQLLQASSHNNVKQAASSSGDQAASLPTSSRPEEDSTVAGGEPAEASSVVVVSPPPSVKRTSNSQLLLAEDALADEQTAAAALPLKASLPPLSQVVNQMQRGGGGGGFVPSSNNNVAFEEDEHGEPVVDESVLQSLAAPHRHDDYEDEDDHDPVMLEFSGHEEEDHHQGGAVTSNSFFPFQAAPKLTTNNINLDLSVLPALPASPDRGEEHDKFDFAFDDDDEEEEDSRLQNNSLVYPHRRLPSTIVEEYTESFRKEDEELVQEEKPLLETELLHSASRPLSEISQRTCSSTGSLIGGPLQKVSSSSSINGEGMQKVSSCSNLGGGSLLHRHRYTDNNNNKDPLEFTPLYTATHWLRVISRRVLPKQHFRGSGAATWIGFWALLHVTCANYVLTPMRDAIALQLGVKHMPQLTLASTVLALFSSVPIGWLFEAPDPGRRKLWKRMGLTRGETQGTSLALFYRCFAFILITYAVGFQLAESSRSGGEIESTTPSNDVVFWWLNLTKLWASLGKVMYIAFFLVVHLMKLHCLSLVWGVTTEAMEYEDVARKHSKMPCSIESNKMRLQRLALVGFGGTLGGIAGSFLASSMAQILRLPGLLLLAASLLEISAELSIELGRIMKKHWEGQQQLFQSTSDLASLDPSMKRSSSLGSMKRISSGNSLNRIQSTSDLGKNSMSTSNLSTVSANSTDSETVNEDTFTQRLMRGFTTILRSRLLMAIFTYNALYASTTVLLSFQRAALVANRKDSTTVQADTAFLANINMASSVAVFALQASGLGAYVAHACGSRGTLSLMPLIRLLGVLALAWWHRYSGGQPPNLMVFLVVDECCKIMNLAVAKPVRESLWRGLSNEARYEAKPIVDTLANRWGGGSAAFLVSFVDKTLDLFGVVALRADGVRNIFGFPPILFLCLIIATWWSAVSVDLGNIRTSIDLELKKRQ